MHPYFYGNKSVLKTKSEAATSAIAVKGPVPKNGQNVIVCWDDQVNKEPRTAGVHRPFVFSTNRRRGSVVV